MEDRTDPAAAEIVFKYLLPDASARSASLKFLAESAHFADSLGSNRWGITLGRAGGMVRLNVGSIEVLAFFQDSIHCVVDIESAPSLIRNHPEVSFYSGDSTETAGAYSTVPSSAICDFPSKLAPKVLPLLRPSHNRLIQASQRALNAAARKAHSSGVVHYLKAATGIPLSNPSYSHSMKNDSVETFLLKSNTRKHPWGRLKEAVLNVRKKGWCEADWTCGRTKRIRRGDRFFLMRTGETPRGIMGAGIIIQEPYEADHFEREDGV